MVLQIREATDYLESDLPRAQCWQYRLTSTTVINDGQILLSTAQFVHEQEMEASRSRMRVIERHRYFDSFSLIINDVNRNFAMHLRSKVKHVKCYSTQKCQLFTLQ